MVCDVEGVGDEGTKKTCFAGHKTCGMHQTWGPLNVERELTPETTEVITANRRK